MAHKSQLRITILPTIHSSCKSVKKAVAVIFNQDVHCNNLFSFFLHHCFFVAIISIYCMNIIDYD